MSVAFRSYVWSFFWKHGEVDILPRIEWRGAEYACRHRVFVRATSAPYGWLCASEVDQAVICWFSSLIWGAFYKERYDALIMNVARHSPDLLHAALSCAVGRRWAEVLVELVRQEQAGRSVAYVRRLRRALWWRAFRRAPFATLAGWVRFWLAEIRLRLAAPVPWLAMLGLDGAGKSTVIQDLANRLEHWPACKGVSIQHWRPGVVFSPGDSGPVTDPHGAPPRCGVSSVAKIIMIVADWSLGYTTRIANNLARNKVVLFDRHYVDLLVDPRRYRYGGPMWLARLVGRLVPKPDIFILLDLPAEVAHARKPEIELAEARRLRERYLDLAREIGAHVVDASRPLDEVVAEVEEIILDHMQRRTRARLERLFPEPPGGAEP